MFCQWLFCLYVHCLGLSHQMSWSVICLPGDWGSILASSIAWRAPQSQSWWMLLGRKPQEHSTVRILCERHNEMGALHSLEVEASCLSGLDSPRLHCSRPGPALKHVFYHSLADLLIRSDDPVWATFLGPMWIRFLSLLNTQVGSAITRANLHWGARTHEVHHQNSTCFVPPLTSLDRRNLSCSVKLVAEWILFVFLLVYTAASPPENLELHQLKVWAVFRLIVLWPKCFRWARELSKIVKRLVDQAMRRWPWFIKANLGAKLSTINPIKQRVFYRVDSSKLVGYDKWQNMQPSRDHSCPRSHLIDLTVPTCKSKCSPGSLQRVAASSREIFLRK